MTTAPPIPCPTCRYDLRGLLTIRGVVCPECGTYQSYRNLTRIDPFLAPIHLLWFLLLTPVAIAAILLFFYFAARSGAAWPTRDHQGTAVVSAAFLCPFAVFYRIFFQPLSRHGRGFASVMAVVPAALAPVVMWLIVLLPIGLLAVIAQFL